MVETCEDGWRSKLCSKFSLLLLVLSFRWTHSVNLSGSKDSESVAGLVLVDNCWLAGSRMLSLVSI